jgi:hypothetical protein
VTIGIALVLIFILYLIDKHNRWRAALKTVLGLGILSILAVCGIYGWEKYDSYRAIIPPVAISTGFESVEDSRSAGSVTIPVPSSPQIIGSSDANETLSAPSAWRSPTPIRPRHRKVVLKRNTCGGLVVYDRETFGNGNPLVIDQLVVGASVQLLGHVTVGDEDIIATTNGQKGFVASGCLEDIAPKE